MKILVTCPPMLQMMDQLRHLFLAAGVEVHCPDVVQTLSEAELINLVPHFDGWIIGDDPATRAVFTAGKAGRLRQNPGRAFPVRYRRLHRSQYFHHKHANDVRPRGGGFGYVISGQSCARDLYDSC